MSTSCPEWIDPLRLADQTVAFSGHYPLAEFGRLAPLLNPAEGEATFEFRFSREMNGRRVVRGNVSAHLSLICQRCLMPMDFPVDQTVCLGVVENLAQAEQLPDEWDPLLVEDGMTSVRNLVEDELLLALPVVARHDPPHCAETPEQDGEDLSPETLESPHPFAALSQWIRVDPPSPKN